MPLILWICQLQVVWFEAAGTAAAEEPLRTLHLAASFLSDQRLADFGEAQQLVFQSKDGKSRDVPMASVVRWGAWRPPQNLSAVWLRDGGWLVGRVELKRNEALRVRSDWFQPLEIPLEVCRGIVVAPPATTAQWYQLQRRMLQAEGDRDFVWLNTGQQLAGVLKGAGAGPNEPTIETERTAFWLESAGRTEKLSFDDVQAVVFCPSLHPPLIDTQSRLALGMKDGSLLNVRSIRRGANARLQITTTAPLALTALDEPKRFAQGVDHLANSPAAVTWLSDLEPARFRHAPQSSIEWGLGRDEDLYHRPLTMGERIVRRGLAMHSSSQATFRWDGKPGKFLCELVMAAPPQGSDSSPGSVQCQVLVARNGKLETVLTTPVLRGDSTPYPVEVDVTGARLVVLLTDMADASQIGDHVLWLDARLAGIE